MDGDNLCQNMQLRPCKKMGYPELTRDISGYCYKHRYIYEEQKKKRWSGSEEIEKTQGTVGMTADGKRQGKDT